MCLHHHIQGLCLAVLYEALASVDVANDVALELVGGTHLQLQGGRRQVSSAALLLALEVLADHAEATQQQIAGTAATVTAMMIQCNRRLR